jgi:hypothetical protein
MNYYKARSGVDGGINMDRGGFTLIRPIHGTLSLLLICLSESEWNGMECCMQVIV